ncbi:hypothetical protein D3C76_948260 [compost metagenome]
MEDAQVELHQVPADDGVRVVARQPVVEPFQQFGAAVAVVELEIHRAGVAVGRAEHVHLALAAAFQGDGIEVAAHGGLDVQRDQAQLRAIVGGRLELGVEQRAVLVGLAAEPQRGVDEALHQVALRRADVGFVDVQPGAAQQLVELDQLAMLLAVQAEHRAMLEVAQLQRAQLPVALALQQRLGLFPLFGRDERH